MLIEHRYRIVWVDNEIHVVICQSRELLTQFLEDDYKSRFVTSIYSDECKYMNIYIYTVLFRKNIYNIVIPSDFLPLFSHHHSSQS